MKKLVDSNKVVFLIYVIMWLLYIWTLITFVVQGRKYNNLEELRPCPFCGSTNIEYIDYDNEIGFEGSYLENYEEVTCQNCGANTFRNKLSTDKVGAREKWNSRK